MSILKNPFAHPFVIFLIKKIIFYAIVMFVAVTLVFFIPRFIPGNPIDRLIPPGMYVPGVDIRKIRESLMQYYGFDKPLLEQYILFWNNLLRGDLGVSVTLYPGVQVSEIVGSRIPYTLELVIPVLIISFLVGNWIGAKAAYVGGKLSEFVYFFSVFSNRLPSFWFGMVLIYLLAIRLPIFPPYGYGSPEILPMLWWDISTWSLRAFLDKLRYFCLPFISLFIVYLGGWATGMRSMVIHELDSGYIRYAEALGFRRSKVQSYAQRNAILPQFTGLNLYLNALIGETTVIETVFGWPGVGRLMYQSVISGPDYSVIFGSFLVVMVVVIIGNFIIDVLYGLVDPRIRIGGGA
ncbi:MAG: ABC transporter permease [Candidatus Brockarchaeota archaeon]|nr:ABC transporter permease [Candidatus Brockarchaeota archaeon]